MNYRMIWRVLGLILLCLAALMLLPAAAGLYYRENVSNFLITIAAAALTGFLLTRVRPRTQELYAREGFVIVGLGWIAASLFGALPFVLNGDIPSYIDAVFETVSGFTTTGASILHNCELLSRGNAFWRQFTHWIGGMGILVFIMAILPMSGDHSMHIMRAEVPGPTVGKLVPRLRATASLLYKIYIVLTALETVLLVCGGLSFFDALLHAFATAGTGGFSTKAASIGAFNSPYVEIVVGIFMLLFGVNFNLYFLLLIGGWRDVLKNEELHWYLGIVAASILAITIGINRDYMDWGFSLRQAFFNVATIISTTGFCTVNFDLWPEYCKWILVLLMFCGACAGSTGGGLKVSRVATLLKACRADMHQMMHPRSVSPVRFEGKRVDEAGVRTVSIFAILYVAILFAAILAISVDNYEFSVNFTAALSCISNIGPGLSLVGPIGNFDIFSPFSKIVLTFVMLVGRLEIYPILVLFSKSTWKK